MARGSQSQEDASHVTTGTINYATLCEFGIHFDRSNVLVHGRPVEELPISDNNESGGLVVGEGETEGLIEEAGTGGEKGEIGTERRRRTIVGQKEGEDRQDAGVKETETSTGPETVPGTVVEGTTASVTDGSSQDKPVVEGTEAATVSEDNERSEETEGGAAKKTDWRTRGKRKRRVGRN